MPHWTGPLPRTQAKLARAEQMLDDGCSYREIHRTLGIHVRSLRAAFPNRGWTQSEGGKLAMAMRKADRSNPNHDFKYGNDWYSQMTQSPLESDGTLPALTAEQSRENKRKADREAIAAKRAQMTPEERAERRKAHDALYREAHRLERQEYDRNRWPRTK